MIFGINTTSDNSKWLYVISRAVRRVKFETILKYHEWYLCQISRTNHAIICLYYYQQKVCNFHIRYFKLTWNTTALSQSNCSNFSCSSINSWILQHNYKYCSRNYVLPGERVSFVETNFLGDQINAYIDGHSKLKLKKLISITLLEDLKEKFLTKWCKAT